MGHAKVTTTPGIYAHLFEGDHAAAMAALGAMDTRADAVNVIRLRSQRGRAVCRGRRGDDLLAARLCRLCELIGDSLGCRARLCF
jgi:hypothetical protein